ncbi:MAG: hypothetical protein HY060_16555 [Proteobacteria bacterium]|nr:hypothetical protein [Pseudomonadota bacterium]
MRSLAFAVALGTLLGCGGTQPPAPAAPSDETLSRDTRAGRLAYLQERPDEAIAQYRAALVRAQARDDIAAIGDLGYNLAVAELRANAPARALAVARATREELERRGRQAFAGLLLVEATAYYRSGDGRAADALAARVQAAGDPEAAARATFLRGLMADERDDASGLSAATAALRPNPEPALQADALELAARLALRGGAAERAEADAAHAVALRQDALDYRGLARALALQGQATLRLGRPRIAADLYLRAGRSAAAQGDPATARPWLLQAQTLADDEGVARAVAEALQKLDTMPAGERGGAGS